MYEYIHFLGSYQVSVYTIMSKLKYESFCKNNSNLSKLALIFLILTHIIFNFFINSDIL